MVTPKWRWVGILNTNLPLMKRNIYHPAIGCSCGLQTWSTLLQSVCKIIYNAVRHLTFVTIYTVQHHMISTHIAF